MLHNKEYIDTEYQAWIGFQYKSNELQTYSTKGNKIWIEDNDVDVVIQRISKRKAIGTDLISLVLLDGRQALNIHINKKSYD